MRQRIGDSMPLPALWQNLQGAALIVGQGGIGSAMTELLQSSCPDLTVLALGRRSQPRLDLGLDGDLEDLSGWLQEHPPLRLVINTAGWLHDSGRGPEKRMQAVNRAGLEQAFGVNAFAPILLAKAVAPAFRHGQPSWFASLSARVGSIGDNHLGGWYGYRAAKAAQNQLLRTLAVEWNRRLPQVCVSLLHPGTTATELSAPFRSAVPAEKLFSPERAAGHLLDVLAEQKADDSGSFLAWDGTVIPW
jgi:NAD(P)-dependent dehydrogenase (short-subunit alcohol dehydrogenase family)